LLILTINDRKIFHENIDKEIKEKLKINPKLAIFLSKHNSKTGEPTLTTHPIGNYGKAKFGGKDNDLVPSSPHLMTELLRIININSKKADLYHKVCFEVTHHGPHLDIPTIFAEVGSTEKEWNNKIPCKIIARSLWELLEKKQNESDFSKEIPIVIGIGGGHYAPRFTDVILEKKISFGHMIPKYQIETGNVNDEILEKAIKNTPNLSGIYIQKKSLKKSQVTFYKNWFKEKNIPLISSKTLSDL